MEDSVLLRAVAIVCLTAICIAALANGIDSTLISVVSGIIGGIAGYGARKASEKSSKQP